MVLQALLHDIFMRKSLRYCALGYLVMDVKFTADITAHRSRKHFMNMIKKKEGTNLGLMEIYLLKFPSSLMS